MAGQGTRSIRRVAAFGGALLAAWALAATAQAADLPEGMSLADAPAWVAPVDTGSIEPGAPSGGLAYRVVDDQVSLRGPRPHEYRLLAYDVLDRTGLEDAGRLRIGFQPDFQRVQLHGLVVIRDGRRADRRATARVELLRLEQRANDGILDGWRTAEILIPDVKVGDRVELSFSTLGSNPVLGEHYHRSFSAAYSTATGLRRLRVLAGPAPLKWRRTGPVDYRERESTDAGGQVLVLQARNLPAIEAEDGAPEWFDGYGVLEVGTAPDWAAVARWAETLFRTPASARARLAREAEALGLAGKPAADAVAKALAFVQGEVRYVSLSIGDSSHAPADPATTLDRRYGDCKDKSLLLVGLLDQVGIEAQPVLVNSTQGRRIADGLPGPNAFDHAIVRARVDGAWLYVDPTRNPELGDFDDRQPADFGQGLPVARGIADLEAFPAAPTAPAPAVEVLQEVSLHGDETPRQVDIRVDTQYRYGFAASNRDRFASEGASRVGRSYLEYMQGYYSGIELMADPVGKDSPDDNQFAVSEHYRTRLVADDAEPGQLGEFNLLMFQLRDWVPAARAATRRWPLRLPGPPRGVQEIRMTAEGGWDIQPEQLTVENAYFRFRRDVSAEGRVLTIRGEWERLAEHIPADDYAAAREQLDQVRDLLEYPVYLGGGDADVPGPEISRSDLAWPGLSLMALAMLLGTLWFVRGQSAVAGVFFAPRRTMRRLVDDGSVPLAMLWLLGSAGLMLALTVTPELVAGARPDWGPVLFEALVEVPRFLVIAALLLLAFRVLGHRPGYRGLVIASAWGAIPMIALLLLALLAAGPLLSAVASTPASPSGDMGVVVANSLVALALLLGGLAWGVVATVAGLAEAARSSAGIAVLALVVTFAALFCVVIIAAIVYLLASGSLPGLS